MTDSVHSLKLFYCYARKDKDLRDRLEIGLSGLKRLYNLTHWHDREIPPGKEWEFVINEQIGSADIILLLISPDFIASDYCYGKEMQRALKRHEAGMCCVIRIYLRSIYLEEMPFGSTPLLPTDVRAISSWRNKDEAFSNVAEGVSIAIKTLLSSRKTVTTHEIEKGGTHEVEFIDVFEYLSQKGHMQKHYVFRLFNGEKIDKDRVEFVMKNSEGDSYCLDTQTGQVICSSEIDENSDESEEELEEIDDSSRHILIKTRITSYEAYQWRKDFVSEIVVPKDEQLSDILFNELEKTRPFRRFKNTLSVVDEKWMQAWYDWEYYHLTEAMNEWFESLPETIRDG